MPIARAAFACLILFALAVTAPAGDLSAVPSAALIRRLDSDSFTEREMVHAELQRRGVKALAALRQELMGLGPEARRRALDLVRQAEDAELRDVAAKVSPLRVRIVAGKGHLMPVLEIRPVANCHLWSVDAVRVGKLSLALHAMPAPVLLVDDAGRPVLPDGAWTAAVRLPAKPRRELAGTIVYRVLLHHPSVAIRDPFTAIGKPVLGMRGVQMTLVKVEREGGSARCTVRIEHTSDLLDAGPSQYVQRQRPGVIVTRSPLTALLDGLELRDAQGRPLPHGGLERLDDAGPAVLCRASFTEAPTDAKGLHLTLVAWFTVRVEAGFKAAIAPSAGNMVR
jgi:hypothetical protein